MRFYDRESEISYLRNERDLSKKVARLTVVTGRRRVGKTQLIQNAMSEQKVGSSQIIEALRDMNDSSSEVSSASKEMAQGNQLILEQVERLKSSADKMLSYINVMDENTRQIDTSSTELIDISTKVSETIGQISAQIDQFEV